MNTYPALRQSCHRSQFIPCVLALALVLLSGVVPTRADSLAWHDGDGVVWATPVATVRVDHGSGPSLRLSGTGQAIALGKPVVAHDSNNKISLVYTASIPDGNKLSVRRRLEAREASAGYDLVETFELQPASPIQQDLEITRPFAIVRADGNEADDSEHCVFPLKNGWVKPQRLSTEPSRAEYRLGHWLGGKDSQELALPVVQANGAGGWQAAICADPRFSAQFTLHQDSKSVAGEIRYRYLASRVPIAGVETRTFGFSLRKTPPTTEPFGSTMDAFFRLMLPDVRPGPQWLHEIYLIKYDYLSDDGKGWRQDVEKLAEWLTPEERKHVALCFHGWYDYLGVYAYNETTGRMKDKWVAMPGSRKVPFTQESMQNDLRRARELGFRVLLYFGDGTIQDSGAPGYQPAWDLVNEKGETPRPTWEGPDTIGKTTIRNPAIPEAAQWYRGYLKALLETYGPVVDGFVWDETFYIRMGDVAGNPAPSYCARGMFDLIKSLTEQVESYDPQKVFLTSDCVGFPGMEDAVGYGMVADGNFQDTWCIPVAWSYGLLPNWRNTSWSCIWAAVQHYHWMQWGVETFGVPVSISNGFGDDLGPAEWTPDLRDQVLQLFRKRMAAGPAHVRFMTDDPAKLIAGHGPDTVPSDPIPTPQAGEVNWALASSGSKATASTQLNGANSPFPANGAIDGDRSDQGWSTGHGWASDGTPMPQWLQVEFPQARSVSRFAITTFHSTQESGRKQGVSNYIIEAWDDDSQQWKPVVREDTNRVLMTRVHALPKPLTTSKFRVVVTRVVPGAAGIARLLQVEAWGGANADGE
ncbi:MAG: discoidin domain-containing protein [Pirellulales bacterium]|nr:discoidin domain-containing protein [Pirellulales bacterium]